MSHFYASIQGGRGEATRGGSKDSGICGHVRGWDSGIKVYGFRAGEQDCFSVTFTSGSNDNGLTENIGTYCLNNQGKPEKLTSDRLNELLRVEES